MKPLKATTIRAFLTAAQQTSFLLVVIRDIGGDYAGETCYIGSSEMIKEKINEEFDYEEWLNQKDYADTETNWRKFYSLVTDPSEGDEEYCTVYKIK